MTEVSFAAVSFTIVLSAGGLVPLALSLQPISAVMTIINKINFIYACLKLRSSFLLYPHPVIPPISLLLLWIFKATGTCCSIVPAWHPEFRLQLFCHGTGYAHPLINLKEWTAVTISISEEIIFQKIISNEIRDLFSIYAVCLFNGLLSPVWFYFQKQVSLGWRHIWYFRRLCPGCSCWSCIVHFRHCGHGNNHGWTNQINLPGNWAYAKKLWTELSACCKRKSFT